MKRINLAIVLSLTALFMFAQEVTKAEISAIRAAYRDAIEQVELNSHAQEQNVPRHDMEVVSHYVIPGCGLTDEIIHYYFTLDEDPESGTCFYHPFFISRSYNVAARKFYEEFLFDRQEAQLLFFYRRNDAIDGTINETRYYYGKKGVSKSIIGSPEMDEIVTARTAEDLKNAFNLLMNNKMR